MQQLALRLRSLRPSSRAKAIGGALKLAGLLRSAVEVARAQEARREAIVGEEREVELRGRRARRRAGGEGGSRVVRRLNEFLQRS